MTTATCLLAALLVALLLPVHALLWATESRHTRIRRWRASGASWASISKRLGCSPTSARRWANA